VNDVSEGVANEGYVLTCSSYVKGDGVKLVIRECDDVWETMHDCAMKDAARIEREVTAKFNRIVAEENVPQWKKETEEVLKRNIEYE